MAVLKTVGHRVVDREEEDEVPFWGRKIHLSFCNNPEGIKPLEFPHAEICNVLLLAYCKTQEGTVAMNS